MDSLAVDRDSRVAMNAFYGRHVAACKEKARKRKKTMPEETDR
jgi:hypothetical protein